MTCLISSAYDLECEGNESFFLERIYSHEDIDPCNDLIQSYDHDVKYIGCLDLKSPGSGRDENEILYSTGTTTEHQKVREPEHRPLLNNEVLLNPEPEPQPEPEPEAEPEMKPPQKIYKRKHFKDSVRKKIKTHFHKYLVKKFNILLSYYPTKSGMCLKVERLNQTITTKVDIKYNKEMLDWTMKELFSTDISEKCKVYGVDYNRNIVEQVYCIEDFHEFLSSTYLMQFEEYKNSDYKKDLEEIKVKNGKEYCKLFQQVADDEFIWYYINNSPNKRTKEHNNITKKRNKMLCSTENQGMNEV